MSEWWTYTLSDLLMFSAQTYYRLFELYNREIWPAQILAIGLGIVVLLCLQRAGAWQGRIVAAILAACWIWVAWAFHIERYATINWAARYFVLGFATEALLLIWIGVVRGQLLFRPAANPLRRAGFYLFLFALALQPLIGPAIGRPWPQAEIFGIAPDPTVVATLGILLLAPGRMRWLLLCVPIIWCVISGATLWAMGSADALLMPLIALLALLLAARQARLTAAGRTR
ncbi:MAG: DUF6064 family protein [Oxalobacteraceae bacterium]|nr:DUF6064 family protein [Oxalobacteraceae bacterium]